MMQNVITRETDYARNASESAYPNLWRGLVAWWCPSINPRGGNRLFDLSPFQNHGTLTNMANDDWVVRNGQGALDITASGAREYIDCGNVSHISGNLTFCGWVQKKTATTVAFRNIWIGGRWNTGASPGTNEFLLLMVNANTGLSDTPSFVVEVGATTSSAISSSNLVIGKFTHVCGVRRGTQIEIWVDGIRTGVSTGVSASPIINRSRNFRIGDADIASDLLTDALFDDVRTYNRALNSFEIRLLASRRGIGLQLQPKRYTYTQQPSGARRRRRILTGMA